MFKLPVGTAAQEYARKKLGVYVANFIHRGLKISDDGWQHKAYDVTLYRLDNDVTGKNFRYELSGTFKIGIGCRDEPKTWEYLQAIMLDADTWEGIVDGDGTVDELDGVERLIDIQGYELNRAGQLKQVFNTFRALRNTYDGIIEIIGSSPIDLVFNAIEEIRCIYGEGYSEEDILQMICYDPVNDMDDDIREEMGAIVDGYIDKEDLDKRYGKKEGE